MITVKGPCAGATRRHYGEMVARGDIGVEGWWSGVGGWVWRGGAVARRTVARRGGGCAAARRGRGTAYRGAAWWSLDGGAMGPWRGRAVAGWRVAKCLVAECLVAEGPVARCTGAGVPMQR